VPSLWRHIKLVAFRLGLLVTLVLLVATAALAYVEIKCNEEFDLPEPTGLRRRQNLLRLDRSLARRGFTHEKDDRQELMAFEWYPAPEPDAADLC
jgi:hypothetical protein